MKTRVPLFLLLFATGIAHGQFPPSLPTAAVPKDLEKYRTTRNSVQPCPCPDPDTVKLKDYKDALENAPILWFANQEQYYPVLPFFSAFDGQDNNGNDEKDISDSQEIAPIDSNQNVINHASWSILDSSYRELSDKTKMKLITVFYRIRRNLKAKDLRRIVASDEQLWSRLEKAERDYFDGNDSLTVYEYYFYYIRDKGLQGHPEDLEYVFIFVPKDTTKFFRAAVGAGHSNFAPNNVLIFRRGEIPTEYKRHLHMLVELGGHSMAPDIRGNGLFEPGVDANWHTENLWGTRDVQAISGRGGTTRYETWMTFPRDSSKKVYPPDANLAKHESRYWYRLFPAEIYEDLEEALARHDSLAKLLSAAGDKTYQNEKDKQSKKELLDSLRIIYAAELDSVRRDTTGFERFEKKAQTSIKRHLRSLERRIALIDTLQPSLRGVESCVKQIAHSCIGLNEFAPDGERLKRLSFWSADLVRNIESRLRFYSGLSIWIHHKIWQPHPSSKFIASFRPTEFDLAISLRPWRKKPVKLDGVFELSIGLTEPRPDTGSKIDKWKLALGLVYDHYYARGCAPYLSFSLKHNRPASSTYTFGAGASFVLSYTPSFGTPSIARYFRLRAGPELEFQAGSKTRLVPSIRLGYHFDVPVPHTNKAYVMQNKKHHRVWDHNAYKADPTQAFKAHLFRPRHRTAFGVWMHWERNATQYRAAWIVPAWEAFTVKTDGVLELHAGWRREIFNAKTLTIAAYYDRYYSRVPFGWYTHLSWENERPPRSDFSLGGGLSITLPPIFNWPIINKPVDLFQYIKVRLGVRAFFDEKSHHLSLFRWGVQLGLHY